MLTVLQYLLTTDIFMGGCMGWTKNVILHDKLGMDITPYWYIIALNGLHVCYIDFDKKVFTIKVTVKNTSFAWNLREVVILLKL